jgi:hypothetical protein
MLSTIQSVFQYISTSDSHPPPPPKEETAPPPGTGTSGGFTLINPHRPNQTTVRGGGPHGAGTLGKGVARPEELVKTAKRENEMFRGAQHQDAHEFLMWVLNQVSGDVEQLESRMAKDPDLGKSGDQQCVLSSYPHSRYSGQVCTQWRSPEEASQGQDICPIAV